MGSGGGAGSLCREMGFDQLPDMRQLKCDLGPGHCVAWQAQGGERPPAASLTITLDLSNTGDIKEILMTLTCKESPWLPNGRRVLLNAKMNILLNYGFDMIQKCWDTVHSLAGNIALQWIFEYLECSLKNENSFIYSASAFFYWKQ